MIEFLQSKQDPLLILQETEGIKEMLFPSDEEGGIKLKAPNKIVATSLKLQKKTGLKRKREVEEQDKQFIKTLKKNIKSTKPKKTILNYMVRIEKEDLPYDYQGDKFHVQSLQFNHCCSTFSKTFGSFGNKCSSESCFSIFRK